MSKNNDLYSDVPPTTHNFILDEIGTLTKKRYVGDFTCKIPDTKTQCLIGKHQAYLDGEFRDYLDAGIRKIHSQIAYLRFTLLEFPRFWRDTDLGYELIDHNIIEAVYDKVIEFEENWMKEVHGPGEENSEKESENAGKETKRKRKPRSSQET